MIGYTLINIPPTQESNEDGFYFNVEIRDSNNEVVSDFVATWDDTPSGNYYGKLTFSTPANGLGQSNFEHFLPIAHDPLIGYYKIEKLGIGNPPDHDVHDPR